MGSPSPLAPALAVDPGAVRSPYLLGLGVGIAVMVGLGLLTRRRLEEPGAREFLLLLGWSVAWQAATALGLLTVDEGWRLFWEKVNWLFPAVVPVVWLAFALAYTGSEGLTRRRAALLLAVPLAVLSVVWIAPEPLAWTSVDFVSAGGVYLVDQQSGALSGLLFVYGAGLTLLGSALLIRFGLSARHLYWDQAVALGVGATAPLAVSLLSILDVTPLQGLNATPYAFALSALAFGNALFRYDLFDHVPATRRIGAAAVTDCIRDGVVVVDGDDRIVRVNPVAERAIGRSEAALLGETVWSALPSAGLEDEGIAATAIYRAPTDGRVYELHDTPITDQHDRTVGHVVLFRDVTGRENREQRLAVLNRTLRHNLRNEMNVVAGYAEQLREQLDGHRAEMAGTIRTVADDLVTLSAKARDAETVMAGRSERPEPAALGPLLETAVEEATADHPGVTVETDWPEGVLVPGTETVRSALYNAVENAVVHNDAADPHVAIRVEGPDDGRVAVVVADDGPGIPASELSAVEEGIETPLKHGSGLGLWIITWGARSLGGETEFDTGDDGTTVRLTLPAAEEAAVEADDEGPLATPLLDVEAG